MNIVWICLCAALALLFSSDAMSAASAAASVFAHGVLPALFPMMVLCGLIKPAHNRGPTAASAVGAIFFAFAAGSPASAQRIRRMLDSGMVKKSRLLPLLAATGVMSPMFFTGTLSNWIGVRTAGWIMLAAHWAAALLTAGLCLALGRHIVRSKEPQSAQIPQRSAVASEQDAVSHPGLLSALPAAVAAASRSALSVCGAMILFSVIAGVLRAMLAAAFPAWTAANAPFLAILWSLLEIGGGSSALLSACALPPLPLLSALCGFSGFSIWLQNLLFVGDVVAPSKLLLLKAVHGIIAFGLCSLFLFLYPMPTQAFACAMGAGYQERILPLLPALLAALSFVDRPFRRAS